MRSGRWFGVLEREGAEVVVEMPPVLSFEIFICAALRAALGFGFGFSGSRSLFVFFGSKEGFRFFDALIDLKLNV